MYTVLNGITGTKKEASAWVKNKFGMRWKSLIESAEDWKYGIKMSYRNETIDFIKFTIDEIKKNPLYKEI